MNGEQECLFIADHLTGKLWHVYSRSNKPPLNWLNRWIVCHTIPNVQNKYVVMDQVGEMNRNPAILSLSDKYGYTVRRTATGASHQKYPDELPHRYIGVSGRSLMEGHKFSLKIWTLLPQSLY